MLKVAVVMLVLIGGIWASGHCDSCGGECSSACGTRKFRACCFNYLRRKRVPDDVLWIPNTKETDDPQSLFIKKLPESWFNEFKSNYGNNNGEDQMRMAYD